MINKCPQELANYSDVVSSDLGWATAGTMYELATLPRYVLIGTDGRILDGDAPRPSSGAVEKLIRQIIARTKLASPTLKALSK